MLARHPDHIDNTVLAQFPEFQDFLSRAKTTTLPPGERGGGLAEPQATPEEAIDAAYRELRAALAEEVLGRVLDKPADFFETVVLDVLLAMGYGGSREDAAQRLGRTGDQGLDGVIYEDRLGLDMIYVQAKRWTDHPVRRPDVQAFVGALQGALPPRVSSLPPHGSPRMRRTMSRGSNPGSCSSMAGGWRTS